MLEHSGSPPLATVQSAGGFGANYLGRVGYGLMEPPGKETDAERWETMGYYSE